ncbi:MAG: hypothetical protein ACR2M0_15655 [Chloroflexia bacterium]
MHSALPILIRAAVGLLLLVSILAACAAPPAATPSPVPPSSPTALALQLPAAVPTGGPAALATEQAAVTAMAAVGTVFPPATDIPGLPATEVARATASPFPTAGAPALRAGAPAGSTARRGDLFLELSLAGDSYLAGENGRAVVTLHNGTGERLFVVGMSIRAVDERGQPLGLAPALFKPLAGRDGPGPFEMMRLLAPGASISQTLMFQLPPADQASGHHYTVQAAARFSRPDLQHPDWADAVPADIATAPVPLHVVLPRPDQYLHAQVTADRQGYRIALTGTDGRPPTLQAPAWGEIEALFTNGSMVGPLPDSADGTWSGQWGDLGKGGARIEVHAWVAARGYVPAIISTTVP